MTTSTILRAYPGQAELDPGPLGDAIDHLIACSEACTACADACLSEATVSELRACIRTDQDCADVCATTARVLSRQTETDARLARDLVQACVTACRACGDECAKHASHYEHCQICAEACFACERVCRNLLAALP